MIDRYPLYVVKKMVQALTGLDPDTFRYHLLKGHIPPPSRPLYEGSPDRERYYDGQEAEAVIRFFMERKFWERFARK